MRENTIRANLEAMGCFIFAAILGSVACASPAVSAHGEEAVLKAYRRIQIALASDDLPEALASAKELESAVQLLIKGEGTSFREATVRSVAEKAKKLVVAKSDTQARDHFAKITKSMIEWLRANRTARRGWQLFHCSMAPDYGFWLQPGGTEIANPYFGREMLRCGEKKSWDDV